MEGKAQEKGWSSTGSFCWKSEYWESTCDLSSLRKVGEIVESWGGSLWKKEEDWKNTWEECDSQSTQDEWTDRQVTAKAHLGLHDSTGVYSSQSRTVHSSTAQNNLYRNRIIQKGHKGRYTKVHIGCRGRRQVKLKLSGWAGRAVRR